MALGPNKTGSIKQFKEFDFDEYHADRLENYIDRVIAARSNENKPFEIMFCEEGEGMTSRVIEKLQQRYLQAGWESLKTRCSRDSRGDYYTYLELR